MTYLSNVDVISNLTDAELIELVNDLRLLTIPDDSIVRQVVIACFGEINILSLQLQHLLWPILDVMAIRFKNYSPHITK